MILYFFLNNYYYSLTEDGQSPKSIKSLTSKSMDRISATEILSNGSPAKLKLWFDRISVALIHSIDLDIKDFMDFDD